MKGLCSVVLLALASPASADDSCSASYGDCRASRCCSEEGFSCFRRRDFYYAQCRKVSETQCGSEKSWLCPGWEKCAASFSECTKGRCCNDASFGCFLNHTKHVELNAGWHAVCAPRAEHNGDDGLELKVLSDGDEILSGRTDSEQNVSAAEFKSLNSTEFFYMHAVNDAFCEGVSEWRCLAAWRKQAHEYMEYLNAKATHAMVTAGLQPAVIAAIIVGSIVAAVCAAACGYSHRRMMTEHIMRLEEELTTMKEAQSKRNSEERVPLGQQDESEP